MRFLETVMGIPMSIDIREASETVASAAAERAFRVLRDADARFSAYRPDSELSRVNAHGGDLSGVSDDFAEVVALGSGMAEASGGAFRIRRPDGSWDLDGVVKGWAADRAARSLAEGGLPDFCLNAGGDVAVSGSPGDGRPWNVGVRSPDSAADVLAVLEVRDGGVATSGAYERGAHMVDGRTDSAATGLRSATVVAADLTTADLLATAVFALGEDGIRWALGHGARGVLAVDAAGRLLGVGELDFAGAEHPR
ncbi:FAD:protein FMN transferase [Leifsonia shinshuensis]|uniref:FAD:protein FMN transferase n=1 Tax=Leifsonia shinshuensis TaxID=150026 RepID=A0A7G6YEP9_9MICO|nr:FAD:protein FMN transferase [Leifsonia shinshuensis]QNE36964.1 FAD:protein FMN transferase [Leifsonia shinshuensis]